MYIGSCTTIMWKLRTSIDNVTVPYLVFHWAQYVCSMILFSFVQFCVSDLHWPEIKQRMKACNFSNQ